MSEGTRERARGHLGGLHTLQWGVLSCVRRVVLWFMCLVSVRYVDGKMYV